MAKNNSPWVLGMSASHNGAICLMRGNEIVVSVQEERLLRRKRWKLTGAQHSLALDYCLDYAGIKPADLDLVVLCAPRRAVTPLNDLSLNPLLEVVLNKIETIVIPHHYAHAVSAFATSGFDEAAILVVDGIGSVADDLFPDEIATIKGGIKEGWEMISLYSASGIVINSLEKHITDGFEWSEYEGHGMPRFGSLGSIFSSVAEQIFGEALDAGKVMGLAPYGSPTFLSREFFNIIDERFVFHDKVPARFRHEDRWPLRQKEYQDLAYSVQAALEEALLYLVGRLRKLCPSENLCYAGGVALNSVANEKIIQEMIFKNVYIIPAAEDSGPAIGAAFYGVWQLTQVNEKRQLAHDALGREYSAAEIKQAVEATPAVEVVESRDIIADTVELMCQGYNIGWFQGRSELGPRALGQRSIICDPRRADAKDILNRRVKHREAFRPFAPVILLEESSNWFEWGNASCESPHMLRIAKFRPEKIGLVPAVEHIDNTGRVQTVTRENNGLFYELVAKFYEKTGVPIILNTSFNLMGMPIVETPEDALYCLLSTGLDYCVLGDTIVKKRKEILLGAGSAYSQPPKFVRPWVLDKYDTRQVETLRAYRARTAAALSWLTPSGLGEYVGVYQNYFGTILIELENDNLRTTFKGYTAVLEHQSERNFVAKGNIFNESIVAFLADEAGVTTDLILIPRHGEAWAEIAKEWLPLSEWDPSMAKFRRLPEGVPAARELEKFTGTYSLEEKMVQVCLRNNRRLIVTVPGQPDYELIPDGGTRFHLQNTPGYSLEFKLSADGLKVNELLVTQPNRSYTLQNFDVTVPLPAQELCAGVVV